MVGKCVSTRVYVHTSLLPELSDELRGAVDEAVQIVGLSADSDFNVSRIDLLHEEVSLLSYPGFFSESFPVLTASWRVHLPTRATTYRDYRSSLNPPVLHRKELLLPDSHPSKPGFAELTKLAESIGLFDDPVRIGFRKQWEQLITSKGYRLVDGHLAPDSNSEPPVRETDDLVSAVSIERHRTALSRKFLSAPVQALLRHRVLEPGVTFFDYGCGRGDDLAGLASLGYAGSGWDPHFRPDAPLERGDVVNLGFVINVIENIDERIAALKGAYELTTRALAVAAILWSSSSARGRPYGDGVLTSRNTFQRFFSQAELQTFIESVTDEQAFPVAPGVFFVFRDRYAEQRFLGIRQMDPTRAPRLLVARTPARPNAAALRRVEDTEKDAARLAALAEVWKTSLELGRLPDLDEYAAAGPLIDMFGSWKRALNKMLASHDPALLERAAAGRMDELRLFFAMQAFERRRNRVIVDPRLRRDIRAFFGSVATAESEGLQLLKRAADTAAINAACERAAAEGVGWLDGDHSLQLHTSLVRRLDPLLRGYIGCATSLYGDVSSTDLVKIHIQSGKVTLMKFDDFEGAPIPRMVERVKVKLREQDLDFFEYGGDYPPTPLFYKSRYINEEFPGYAEQIEFDVALEELGLVETTGYGPSEGAFAERLRLNRRRIAGMRLAPADDIPSIDDFCGKTFTYRQLIECGETWQRIKVENTPKSAGSFNALHDLAVRVLDPVVEYFGAIKITYGFASPDLTRHISSRIDPRVDQHAACESNARGKPICSRRGAAVDFIVEYEDMRDVARWIASHCAFDRMYLYGDDRPLHVSVGPDASRDVYEMLEKSSRRIPHKLAL